MKKMVLFIVVSNEQPKTFEAQTVNSVEDELKTKESNHASNGRLIGNF